MGRCAVVLLVLLALLLTAVTLTVAETVTANEEQQCEGTDQVRKHTR